MKSIRIDLLGQAFGRWVVIGIGRKCPRRGQFWVCRCDCGAEREVLSLNLRRGGSNSCGCLTGDRRKVAFGQEPSVGTCL